MLMELYDIETDSEVFTKGIHVLDPIKENSDPKAVFNAVYRRTQELLGSEKFLTFFGGEHSISIGIIKAFYERYPDLTVLQLDAHTDLRPTYQGSPYNHACALYDASLHTNLIQVGIRSMDSLELPYLNRKKCFFAQDIHGREDWIGEVLNLIKGPVYITVDLDVFDPSIMPSTGTPEPGGIGWYSALDLLRSVFRDHFVVGFDIIELAPIEYLHGPNFLAAKLYYKMLTYKFELDVK
jgi:agmatinase